MDDWWVKLRRDFMIQGMFTYTIDPSFLFYKFAILFLQNLEEGLLHIVAININQEIASSVLTSSLSIFPPHYQITNYFPPFPFSFLW